jgi:phosphoglycerate dehydrogenase-like enzyme
VSEPGDASIVIAVGFDFAISDELAARVRAVHPETTFVSVPYVESKALRSARGTNNGRLTDGLEAPSISPADEDGWRSADIAILWDLPDDIARLAPNLRWMQSVSAGVDKYDVAALADAGIRLTNASGIAAASMSEFVLARLLQVWKELRFLDARQDRREWKTHFGTEVAGKTVGVAGLGAIGRQVARRLRAFDIEVLATRASARPGDLDPDVDTLYPADDLDTMLSRCDAVVACLPTTDVTVDLFDEGRFSAMPAGSIFCNVGRGVQVVESDLIAALESGHLAAAVLDVTRTEPLPADSPLWGAPNVYLSPHSSASLDRYAENLETLIVENLRRFITGDALLNEVNHTQR